MKPVLKLSLLFNVILIIAALALLNRLAHNDQPGHGALEKPSKVQVVPEVTSEPTRTGSVEGFSWQRLESTDYRRYVANLRAIGCPERTVRDIVTADVHSLFVEKRRGLGGENPTVSALWSTSREGQVIALLVGPNVAESQSSTPAAQDSDEAVMPAVLRELGQANVQLDPSQQEALNELRKEFIENIGGTNQDPGDAGYGRKWRKAQPESDQLLRGMIGVNAFMQLQNGE